MHAVFVLKYAHIEYNQSFYKKIKILSKNEHDSSHKDIFGEAILMWIQALEG